MKRVDPETHQHRARPAGPRWHVRPYPAGSLWSSQQRPSRSEQGYNWRIHHSAEANRHMHPLPASAVAAVRAKHRATAPIRHKGPRPSSNAFSSKGAPLNIRIQSKSGRPNKHARQMSPYLLNISALPHSIAQQLSLYAHTSRQNGTHNHFRKMMTH